MNLGASGIVADQPGISYATGKYKINSKELYIYMVIWLRSVSKTFQLGCGAGLPGIYAFLKGAKVTFQDYVSVKT